MFQPCDARLVFLTPVTPVHGEAVLVTFEYIQDKGALAYQVTFRFVMISLPKIMAQSSCQAMSFSKAW